MAGCWKSGSRADFDPAESSACLAGNLAQAKGDGWEAYYGGSWQEIPADAILRDELNRVPLPAHICERAGFVYCFLRGGGS